MRLSKRTEAVKELMISKRGIKRRNKAPFPQANSIEKLIQVIQFAKKGATTKESFKENLSDIHTRQVDYYINALIYLGALKERNNRYYLHKRFEEVTEKKALMEFMLQNQVLRESVTLYYVTQQIPSENEISRLLVKHGNLLGESTIRRRVKTVQSWTKWILKK